MSLFTANNSFTQQISHYEIEITFSPPTGRLRCHASVLLTAEKNCSDFYFVLGDFCEVETVCYLGLPLIFKKRKLSGQQNLLKIKLPRKADIGEKLTLTFTYTGALKPSDSRGCINTELCELPPESNWYPAVPGIQKYTANITVITPGPMRIIATGNMAEEKRLDTRYQTHWASGVPGSGLHIVAGQFNRTERKGLAVYYPRPLVNQARSLANSGEKIVEHLKQLLGEHPAGECTLIIIEQERPEAHVSTQLNTISSGLLARETTEKNTREKQIVLFRMAARELGRRWLEAALPSQNPADTWYLTALAEYTSWMLVEAEYGVEVRNQIMAEAKLNAKYAGSIHSACSRFPSLPDWLLSKGSWLMRIVHCALGNQFYPLIQEVFSQHDRTAPEAKVFFSLLAQKAGTNFDHLYHEWVVSSRKLILELDAPRTFTDENGQWQLVFSLVNRGKLRWQNEVEMQLISEDGSKELKKFTISNEPFLISSPSRVTEIEIDPQRKLLNWAKTTKYTV
ncbi:MAG: M1 family metallopeptidase [Firmicutes bacterium]|nr:M1 family metallopeptidase [Bacillota bacterium]